MAAKITRREWAAALAVASAPAQAPAQPDSSQTTAALMIEARGELRQDIQRLEKFSLPAAAEPAFIFRP